MKGPINWDEPEWEYFDFSKRNFDIYNENHPLHHMLYWVIEEWDEAMKMYDESQS